MIEKYIGPLLGLALVSISGTTATAQQKAEEPVTVTGDKAPVYDVVSIKPNKSASNWTSLFFNPSGFVGTNVTPLPLIRVAYGVEDYRISGAPSWLRSDHYDIEAKMDSDTADSLRKLPEDQASHERLRMMQALLSDRFKLALHKETKELATYTLVVAKNGPKLHVAQPGDTYPNGIKGPDGVGRPGLMRTGRGQLVGQGVPLSLIAKQLTSQLGRVVVDKTGLTDTYDFTLQWAPDEGQVEMHAEGVRIGVSECPV